MHDSRPRIRSLGVERRGRAAIFEFDEPPLPRGGFRVDTLYSGLSAGTELTYLNGTNPKFAGDWDGDMGVYRSGRPGRTYPVTRMGYMEVARVRESDTAAVRPGEMLAMSYGHLTSRVAVPHDDTFVAIPPDLDPVLGIYLAQMGPICANGLLHAAADAVGRGVATLADGVRDRRILVMGGGVVGLLTGLFARHHGAEEVAIADVSPRRLRAAAGLGLVAIDERAFPAWRWCKERWRHGPGDRGADLAFQCRSQIAQLHSALRSLRPQATVIDLAFYQAGAPELRLGDEFHHNGLGIRSAQIGRRPRGVGERWDTRRLSEETLALLRAHQDAVRAYMITDVIPLDDGPQLLADLAAHRRECIQVVFDMSFVGRPRGAAAVATARE
jgi:threonine dehydrogenase-like Zn-dependent dehydrogenase